MAEKQNVAEVIVLLAIIPIAFAIRAWAFMMLWTWFVVPLGVVSISFWWAAGLSGFFYWATKELLEPAPDKSTEFLIGTALSPVLVVGLAYLITLGM